jgi:hypothetical protein
MAWHGCHSKSLIYLDFSSIVHRRTIGGRIDMMSEFHGPIPRLKAGHRVAGFQVTSGIPCAKRKTPGEITGRF